MTAQKLSNGWLIFLPLPPSNNARMIPVRFGSRCQSILTKEARDYIWNVGTGLKLWARSVKFKAIDRYTYVDLWFVLPRTSCDSHNYFKVLLDSVEAGGLCTNDKYLMPAVCGVWHDAKNPEVTIKLRA